MVRFCLLLTLFLPVGYGIAQETEIDGANTFTIGVQEFYYPPHYYMQAGRYSGFGRDVLDLFARHRGYRFIYHPQPYIRNVVELLGGKSDFQYPDNINWLVEMKSTHEIFYSDGVVGYMDGINRHKEDLGKPLADLKRLAMPIGWTAIDYEPLVEAHQLSINEVASVEAVIGMLLKRRVDGVYLNADVVNFHFTSIGREGDVSIDPSLPYSFGHFSLSTKKHPKIILEFNQFLLEQAQEVAELKHKYRFKYEVDPAQKVK